MRLLPILLVFLAGCATSAPADTPSRSIANSSWEIMEIDGLAVPEREDQSRFRLAFRADRVSGRAGCNSFTGPYSHTGDRLEFGTLAATRMACPEPYMEYERRAFAILRGNLQIRFEDAGLLTLSGPAGTLELRRSSDAAMP